MKVGLSTIGIVVSLGVLPSSGGVLSTVLGGAVVGGEVVEGEAGVVVEVVEGLVTLVVVSSGGMVVVVSMMVVVVGEEVVVVEGGMKLHFMTHEISRCWPLFLCGPVI